MVLNWTARLPYDPITLLPTDVGLHLHIIPPLSNICHWLLCITYVLNKCLVNFPEGMEQGKIVTFGSGAIKGLAV